MTIALCIFFFLLGATLGALIVAIISMGSDRPHPKDTDTWGCP